MKQLRYLLGGVLLAGSLLAHANTIDEVMLSPAQPVLFDTVVATVNGHFSTAGYVVGSWVVGAPVLAADGHHFWLDLFAIADSAAQSQFSVVVDIGEASWADRYFVHSRLNLDGGVVSEHVSSFQIVPEEEETPLPAVPEPSMGWMLLAGCLLMGRKLFFV